MQSLNFLNLLNLFYRLCLPLPCQRGEFSEVMHDSKVLSIDDDVCYFLLYLSPKKCATNNYQL